ncbi:MAG: cytochrome c [Sneathiella sp.]|nr:cytochrome c [Sneathiella sp.]
MVDKKILGPLALGIVIVAGYFGLANMQGNTDQKLSIKMPELSETAQAGARAFGQSCAACHGKDAGGTDQGPPLIHPIYNPGHHSDQSFFLAAQNGVRAHHWNFGNMPALRHVSPRVISDIVAYIREVQRANGIVTQKHKM